MNSSYSFVQVLVGICGFIFLPLLGFSQDGGKVDSLIKVYQEGKLVGLQKLENLKELSFNETNDLKSSIKYAEELIDLSLAAKNYKYLHSGYLQKGNNHLALGNFKIASEAAFSSLNAAIKAEDVKLEAAARILIGNVYSEQGNFKDKAELFYRKAIQLLRESHSSGLGEALYNIGDHYLINEEFDLALSYFNKAGEIFEKNDHVIGKAYILGNTGKIYGEKGQYDLGVENIKNAIVILEELNNNIAISEFQIYMSDIYLKKDDLKTALKYAHKSLDLSLIYGLKKQISDANLQLSKLYEKNGDQDLSLEYGNAYKIYIDSVTSPSTIRQLEAIQKNHEDIQKQLAFDHIEELNERQKTIMYISIFAFVLIFLLALSMFRRYKFAKKTNRIIEQEKNKSENLLLNILPKETAQELRHSGKVQAQKFESITVLFTDFKGFTQYAENISPEILVKSVDYYFSKFDEIMEKHNLEKIKTIGDSYMCAGGLHYHKKDHALKMVEAAFEISEFVEQCKKKNSNNIICFDMRIGINTGPVVAGVVGTRKFAYDIWGDAVNIASRMESNSEPGKINVSENTYNLINDVYSCEYRGEINVKNKGMTKMYFVNEKKDKQQPSRIKERESMS